jgi:serine/threonine protein kinase
LDKTVLACPGSYGVVSKVNHTRTGEALAIKSIKKVSGKESTHQILREIGILEVCDHRNIVRLVEAFRTEDNARAVHLVLAPWAPFTLHDFLDVTERERATRCAWFQQGSVESDRVIYRIMYELTDAVNYLHANEIKHKDIKPENILLYREGDASQITPLITDFGVSKVFAKHALTNYTKSTRMYLAPEQLLKHSSTLSADVWQLGCCFAHLLARVGGGRLGHEELLNSYMRSSDENCSYQIATEHPHFMAALGKICKPGNSALKRVYGVVSEMLNLDPVERLDIELVRTALTKFAGTPCK